MGASITLNNNTEQLHNRLQQRRTWYKCILQDLNTKRLDVFDVDPMLDLLNIVKKDIHYLENESIYSISTAREERSFLPVLHNNSNAYYN